METETKFYSMEIIQSVTKNEHKRFLKKLGYFNIRYSGKIKGFFADFIKGREPII